MFEEEEEEHTAALAQLQFPGISIVLLGSNENDTSLGGALCEFIGISAHGEGPECPHVFQTEPSLEACVPLSFQTWNVSSMTNRFLLIALMPRFCSESGSAQSGLVLNMPPTTT